MKVVWEGVMPAVTTKFTEVDALDVELFLKNLDAQLRAGVQGIILGGTLGEASTLEDAEKETLVRATVDRVKQKVPVIINVAEQSTRGAIRAAENAQKFGADALMMLPPMRYKASSVETVTYFSEVAKNSDLPVMIYNNPVDYGIEVTLPMFEKLLQFPTIQAVKESTRDITNITRLRNAFGDRLKILCGVDTLAFESLVAGADGWVAGLVCAFPEETTTLYRLVKSGKYQEALALYRWFMPLLELDINPRLVQNIKLAEVATGLGSEWVRAPRLPLQGAEREQVQQIIDKAMADRPELS